MPLWQQTRCTIASLVHLPSLLIPCAKWSIWRKSGSAYQNCHRSPLRFLVPRIRQFLVVHVIHLGRPLYLVFNFCSVQSEGVNKISNSGAFYFNQSSAPPSTLRSSLWLFGLNSCQALGNRLVCGMCQNWAQKQRRLTDDFANFKPQRNMN